MRALLWPRSLAGQLALIVALALFVAQGINLGLLLRERAALRLEQSAGPAAIRLVDAIDRENDGRSLDRGRVRRTALAPDTRGLESQPDVVAALRNRLTAADVPVGRIAAVVVDADRTRGARRWRRGAPRSDHELLIAVEQPGRGWLVTRSFWPDSNGIVWRLLLQTAILYAVVLLPVLWIARRISRPLGRLAIAAREFSPHNAATPVPEHGPGDVRAVIAAYNGLGARVVAMLDEKDRMLGAIGHDLRTPLAALRVRIESVDDEADRARMADTIHEMDRTLDDILSLARLGRPSEAPTEVDLTALVDAVVEDFRDLERDVTFEDGERLRMRLRPSLVRRAIRNLIENAIKYAGSAQVTIDRGTARVAIQVADRGPGIPADRLADVFMPFTRLETSRNRETGGIGLGLALARAIAQEAGGDIVLANRDGGGLTATMWLPR